MTQQIGGRIWSPRFAVLFALNLVITMAQFMTLALIPKLADSLGATAVVVGIVTGVFAVTALAVRPAVGWATLKARYHHLLVATVVVIAIAFVLYAFTPSVPVLIAARLLHGAAMGFLAPVTLAMASDALPPARMAQGIAIFSLGQAVSTAAGPAAGLWILATAGYRVAFLAGAGALLAAAVAASFLRSPRPEPVVGRRFGLTSFIAVEAIVPAVIMFCLAGAFSGVNSFIVLYGEARGVEQIGLFFAAYAVFIVLSRPFAGLLADRHGLGAVVIPGMVLFAVSLVIISQVSTLTGFLIAGAISALGYGICQPAIQTLSLTSVDRARSGVASNTHYVGVDLGYLIGPVIAGGMVTTAIGDGAATSAAYSGMYLALTVPIALGLLVFLLFARGAWGRRAELPFPQADT
jgi:MFS family permease